MERKHFIILLIFLGLICVVAFQQGLFWDSLWNRQRGMEITAMRQRLRELEDLRKTARRVREELTEVSRSVVSFTDVYMPGATDPLAWANRQLYTLARYADIEVDETIEVIAPRIPARRGEPDRVFAPCRLRWEMTATLDQVIALVDDAQRRNPYLHVAGLEVQPVREEEERRRVVLTLEWPAWVDPALLELTRQYAVGEDS